MVEGLMALINLFFVPVIALSIFCKLKKLNDKLSILFTYSIFVVLIFLITRLSCSMATFLFEIVFNVFGGGYCLLAVGVSILLPYIANMISIKIIKKDKHMIKDEEIKDETKESR